MFNKYTYNLFVDFVIIIKIIYILSLIRLKIGSVQYHDIVVINNAKLEIVSNTLIFLLLIIVFWPGLKGDICIQHRERESFFLLGVLGLFHIITEAV